MVNLSKINISLETHLFKNVTKRSKPSIKSVLSEHPFAHYSKINILNEYYSCLVTKMMENFVVELFASVSDVVMVLGN